MWNSTKIKLRSLSASQFDLLQYFGSMAHAVVIEEKMEQLGWAWTGAGSYHRYIEGPAFCYVRGNDKLRYNIRPWKKATGQYVWRCHHPAFKKGDEFVEFLEPVSCAVAQEVQGE